MTGSKSLLEDYVKKNGPTVTYGDNGKGFTETISQNRELFFLKLLIFF